MDNAKLESYRERILRPEIREISAYHVPDASGLVKLDAMENPYPWPGSMAGWPDVLAGIEVNRYPDPKASAVVDALRRQMAIADKYQVLLGNGSDEIIHLLIQCIASESALVLSPEPSFVMYRVLADANRVGYLGVPLQDDFQLDMPGMLKAIEQHQPQLIFLACPNNPTGVRYPEADIRQLIEASQGLVVIDEAYTAFSDADALSLLEDYPNVVVMRTLSKVGLAGLRLGILIGHPGWVGEIDKLRLPYNINTLTQAASVFALENYSQLQQQALEIRQTREQLVASLEQLPTARLWRSEANFVLFKTREGQAQTVFNGLKEKGILIKCLDGAHLLLQDCLRVTVGTPNENQRLVEALESLL